MYRIEFRPAALRGLRKLDSGTVDRVRGAVALLATEPRPPASKKLYGRDAYRLRIGHYRIIYTIDDAGLVVVVVLIGHRSSVYR
jgi:mRNA interferase RelE/StbE